jgi:coenzyme F420-0:L-glutamate ligase/coenzyme F420-1:gamma-L-glutamate ligase
MNKKKIEIIGLKSIPLIKEGDIIANIIVDSLGKNNLTLNNGDILVIAQTIISKSNGNVKNLREIKPSQEAMEIFENIKPKMEKMGLPIKDPRLIQMIIGESRKIIKVEHVLITETKHGFVCANAGIDKSNVEGEEHFSLLPENSDEDAEKIRKSLKLLTEKDIAIIISDSFGRPFRIGSVGVALGVSGIEPLLDKRGQLDLFGYELKTTIIGQVDALASAAQLIMGEADEGIPIVLIRGYDFNFSNDATIKPILREKSVDLFRTEKKSEFVNFLKSRRSYKLKFDSKIVDIEIIKRCIELARWAPSAHNGQFWRYIIIEQGQLRENLINEMNNKLRRDLEKDGKSERFIDAKINKSRDCFLKAPVLILLCMDSKELEKYANDEQNQNEFMMGVQSISSSATYLLLAFELEKLASCWHCAPLFAKEIVRNNLNLPKSYIPMAFFTVGYPIKDVKAPSRKSVEEIIYQLKNST